MSKPRIPEKPAARPAAAAPTTPPAGPDRRVSLARSEAPAGKSPPALLHHVEGGARRRRQARRPGTGRRR